MENSSHHRCLGQTQWIKTTKGKIMHFQDAIAKQTLMIEIINGLANIETDQVLKLEYINIV